MSSVPFLLQSSTLKVIGNTPLVQLQTVPENSADVLIKLEYFNPTGSYKDRMALAMIEEAEAREMARLLAKEEGIFAGTSTGLNVVGAIQLAQELGPGRTVVTVAVDTGLKYLGGDLYEV